MIPSPSRSVTSSFPAIWDDMLLPTPVTDSHRPNKHVIVMKPLHVQATPVYRTNDPFTFKINDFKLPSDLVDDIVNKRYPACLAVLITESLELEGLWVPSASPNIKDKVRTSKFRSGRKRSPNTCRSALLYIRQGFLNAPLLWPFRHSAVSNFLGLVALAVTERKVSKTPCCSVFDTGKHRINLRLPVLAVGNRNAFTGSVSTSFGPRCPS